ncbi:MAG: hypothetical protein AAF958_04890 [Planctomycetota bacterium]
MNPPRPEALDDFQGGSPLSQGNSQVVQRDSQVAQRDPQVVQRPSDAWQKLLSGDADIASENEVLVFCEAHPTQYRALVLEWIENRRIRDAFAASVSAPCAAEESKVSRPQTSIPNVIRFCVAAALGGILASLAWNTSLVRNVMRSNGALQSSTQIAAGDDASKHADLPTRLADANANDASQSLAPEWIQPWVRPSVPMQVRQNLRRAGIEVAEEADIYWLVDEQGTPHAFPHRNIEFRYVPTSP